MNKINKILIIGPDGEVGGVKTHVNNLQKVLIKSSSQIICTQGEKVLNILYLRFKYKPEVVIYNLSIYRNKLIRNLITRTVLTKNKCRHILHLHGGNFQDFKFFGIKLLKSIFYLHFNRFECIYCLTKRQEDFLLDNFRFKKKIKKISNYIQLPEVINEHKNYDSINLLYVGRLHKLKGVEIAIHAVRQIKSKKIKLYIVGSGPLESVIAKINSDKISFEGVKFGEDLNRYYKISHIFLFPSSWPEGLPYVLLEAASYGLAIISTKVGAANEIINDGVNGLFVKENSSKDLKNKIEILLKDKDLLKKMGNESKNICKMKFSLNNLENLYKNILS